jgi:transposase
MRYELTDKEWTAIKPMLPNKPRGVPRVSDRRVLNGIFWVLRSGAPWRDLPQEFGPYTTCYNRFVRWRRAGVWGRIMSALFVSTAPGEYPTKKKSDRDTMLQSVSLPGSQLGRTVLQQNQALPACGNALRQARGQLPRIRPARIYTPMATR